MLALKDDDIISLVPNIALYGDAKRNFFFAFNVITGEQFRLNSTSFWVIESITEGIKWAKLKESFFQKFDVEWEQGDKDLNSLARHLQRMGLVEIERGEKQ
jgi:hypothetical protein